MDNSKKYLSLIPFLAFMGVFYLYALFYGVLKSLGFFRIMGGSEFTFEFYSKMFSNKVFYSSLLFTARVSLLSALLSLIISVVVIYLLYKNIQSGYINGKAFEKILEAPMLVPYLIGAYSILVLFMQNGIISQVFQKIGLIQSYSQFPILTNEKNGIGIIITYVWKTVPFLVMMTLPVVKRISNRWEPLARVYNVKSPEFFIRVVFPLILPTLTVSFFIILSYFFIAFETPYLLGVTHPKSLAVYIYDIYSRGSLEERGHVMAMNITISVFTLIVGGIIAGILRLFSNFDEKGWG